MPSASPAGKVLIGLPFANAKIIQYDKVGKQYIINQCPDNVRIQYCGKFNKVVKLMLDYN